MTVCRWVRLGLLLVVPAVLCGCGSKKSEEAAGPAKSSPEYAVKDAVKRLDAKDYKGFIEHYLPPDELRRMREDGEFEQAVASIGKSPEFKRAVDVLKKAVDVKPEISEDGTWATFKVELKESDVPAAKVEVKPLPDGKDVKLTGYGDDVKQVLTKAVEALKARKFDDFIDSMFPAAELEALKEEGRRARLLEALNATADAEGWVLPLSSERMLADLTAMQSQDAKLEDDGKTAAFTLPAIADPPEKAVPERTVKLQLVAGSWRFYDNTPEIRKQTTELVSSGKRRVLETPAAYVAMERFGDSWRIANVTEPGDPKPEPRRRYRGDKTKTYDYAERSEKKKSVEYKSEYRPSAKTSAPPPIKIED